MGYVYISKVNFNAPGNDHRNLNEEWVEITNSGDYPVSLRLWSLYDREDRHIFTFKTNFVLEPGASVRVYSGVGINTTTAVYMREKQAVWNNTGDTATLKNPMGKVIDQKSN